MPRSIVIHIAQVNLNGLSSKVNLLADFAKTFRLDVVAVTESHLLDCVLDSFVQISNYTLIRSDVSGNVPKHGIFLVEADFP